MSTPVQFRYVKLAEDNLPETALRWEFNPFVGTLIRPDLCPQDLLDRLPPAPSPEAMVFIVGTGAVVEVCWAVDTTPPEDEPHA